MNTNAEEAPTDSPSDSMPSNENGSNAAASGGDASMVAEPDKEEAKAVGGGGDDATWSSRGTSETEAK